jgi:hypothetical protein
MRSTPAPVCGQFPVEQPDTGSEVGSVERFRRDSRNGKGQQRPFPCCILGERGNLFSVRVSESNTLLNLIERVRDQFPRRIRMSAFVLRDTTQMSLSALQFFERTFHVWLCGKRNASTEARCRSNDGDREHLVGILVEKSHESFL